MSKPLVVNPAWKQFATPKQLKVLEAIEEHGSQNGAAKALGIRLSSVWQSVKNVKRRALLGGYSPEHDLTNPIPAPYVAKGHSTLRDGKGNVLLQWTKTKLDEELNREMVEQWYADLAKEFKGLSPLVPTPRKSDAKKLSVYCVGDPHFGLYAWAEEAGEDFDVDKAQAYTQAAIDRLVECSPPSEEALLIEIGDLLHADDSKNRTPASGHALDVDTRHFKVVGVALQAMRNAVLRLLEKHKTVRVWIIAGNHDPHSSIGVLYGLDGYFANNPRVIVEKSPAAFRYHRFGNVLIGATHGDTVKADHLPGVMATDQPKWWGATEHRVWWTGHIHHLTRKEFPGCEVESMRTMAAKDAWHTSRGYRSRRDMQLVVYDHEYGEIERFRADSAMFRAKFG